MGYYAERPQKPAGTGCTLAGKLVNAIQEVYTFKAVKMTNGNFRWWMFIWPFRMVH